MPENYTNIYKYWVAEPGTRTADHPYKDRERWEIVETQIYQLYALFGNGVRSGWAIQGGDSSSSPRIYITPGYGHVYYKYAETTANYPVDLLVPPGIDMATTGATFYVYGMETPTTHYDKTINFAAFMTKQDDPSYIYLGSFLMRTVDGAYTIVSQDPTDRQEVSIFNLLSKMINDHVHLGGVNPSKINLRLHTSGQLPASAIQSGLNASQLTSGKIPNDRLPQIDHDTLSNSGSLQHRHLDALAALQQTQALTELSDTALGVLLRTLLVLKSTIATIDKQIFNIFMFIPGVTPAAYIDVANTTATVDEENNQIIGGLADASASDFVVWQGATEFQAAIDEYDEAAGDYADSENNPLDLVKRSENIVINDEGQIELATPLNFRAVHVVSGTNAPTWRTHGEYTNTDPDAAGNTVPVSGAIDLYKFFLFKSGGSDVTQNWSQVNKLQFGIQFVDPSVIAHGQISFFLIGADHGDYASSQITIDGISRTFSHPMPILGDTEQTNDDDNIKIITVDLLQFPIRTAVQGIGFYISSADGWVLNSYEFSLHQPPYAEMDSRVEDYLTIADPYNVETEEGNVTAYCYNDLYRSTSGHILFRFSQPLQTTYDEVHWDATIPAVPEESLEPSITVRTRTAALASALPYQSWDLVSETTNEVVSPAHENIDILVELNSSSDRQFSPSLTSAALYYTTLSESNEKVFSSLEQLSESLAMSNTQITAGTPNKIEMANTSLVNATFFLEGSAMKVIDDEGDLLPNLSFTGENLYLSPRQAFMNEGQGFRNPRSLQILSSGNYLIADTWNDRVIEIDADGDLVRGVQGNAMLPMAANRDFVVLSASYNQRLGKIFVAFSRYLSSDISKEKFTLATTDRQNSIVFSSDEDGVFSTIPDSSNESAVLVIKLGAERKQQVDTWGQNKVLLISAGAVIGKPGSSSSSSPEPGAGEEGSASPTTINNKIYDSNTGTVSAVNPAEEVVESANEDETTVFDFDGDETVDNTTLMDLDGNTSIATIDVVDGDIIYGNVLYPVFAERVGSNNYLIAQAHNPSTINIGMDGTIAWSFNDTLIAYDSNKGGSASLVGGNVICASPVSNKVAEIVPSTKSIVFSHTPQYTPIYALRLADGHTVIVESDETDAGLNSRVYELDENQDVVREWGLGRLSGPTGVSVLTNGNWLISC